jgi:hypothetical protein
LRDDQRLLRLSRLLARKPRGGVSVKMKQSNIKNIFLLIILAFFPLSSALSELQRNNSSAFDNLDDNIFINEIKILADGGNLFSSKDVAQTQLGKLSGLTDVLTIESATCENPILYESIPSPGNATDRNIVSYRYCNIGHFLKNNLFDTMAQLRSSGCHSKCA